MAPREALHKPTIGEIVKVHLPGESPWAECMAIYGDETWSGKIINRLFAEMSEHEQARFTKQEFGTVAPLPRLHDFRQNQVVRFRRELADDYEIWVPALTATERGTK